MTVEDRLRRALHDEARASDVSGEAWSRIQSGVRARRRARRATVAALSAAAVVAVAVGVGSQVLDDDDGRRVVVGPADSRTSTTTTETTAVPAPEPEPVFPGIWPFHSEEEADAYAGDPGVGMFFDRDATALEFAREYLGMPDPVFVRGRVIDESSQSGFVSIRAGADSPVEVAVQVRGTELGVWYVTGAQTPNIDAVEWSLHGDTVRISGQSTAFEATVQVEVRDDRGSVLGTSFVMGGANGEMAPFEGEVAIDPPSTPGGAIVLTTESMEDGGVQEATVLRIWFPAPTMTVSVFFHDDEERLVEVQRLVPKTTAVLRAALTELFRGPQPGDGNLLSWFSADTVDDLLDVNLRDGTAIVDLDDEDMAGANSAAGGRALQEALNATVFQFAAVDRIEYRLRGSCDAFWQWQQAGDCQLVERP